MAHGGFWKVNKIAFKLLEGLLTLHVFWGHFLIPLTNNKILM